MSSLYKLSISGIRSFSPKDHETIQFGSPLTLICGQNGCGKTTIIESLKYVTTGDLPPNSKGGAFVNDPAIADRLLVNAEIKLGFISVDGKLMTVTRNMQLNRKRAVRGSSLAANTFKSLEGQLAVIANGHKTSYSTKNLELDSRVPLYLGASKAVLEYVIFCHQDDSLWPLSEAGILKKRFDEIFEALKFTKALDNLKLIRKDMATNIKFIEQSVQHSKVDQARAQKIRERLHDSTQMAEKFSLEIAQLTVQIEELEKQAEHLFHSNQAFQKTLSEHERLRIMILSTSLTLKRLEDGIKLLPESEEELAAMLANFEEVQVKKESDLAQIKYAIIDLEGKLRDLEREHHKLMREEGTLLGKKAVYEQKVQEQSELKSSISKKFSLNPNDGADMDELLLILQNDVLASDVVRENEKKRDVAKKELQEASNHFLKESERQAHLVSDTSQAKEKVKRLKAELSAVSSKEDTLEVEKALLESIRSKFEKKKQSVNTKEQQDQIDSDKAKLSQLEKAVEDTTRAINTAGKKSEMSNKMDLLNDSLAVNKNMLLKYITSHKDAFEEHVKAPFSPYTCEDELESAIQKCIAEVKTCQASLESHKSIQQGDAVALDSNQKHMRELEEKIQKLSANVHKVIEPEEVAQFDDLLAEAEDDCRTAQFNCNTFEVTKSYKTKAIEIAKERSCCTLCNRGMSSSEKEIFITEVQLSILSATAEKLQFDLKSTEKDLAELKAIQLDVYELQKVKREVGELESRILKCSEKLKIAKQEVDVDEKNKAKVEGSLDELSALKKPISKINALSEERSYLENQIEVLKKELDDAGADHQSVSTLQKVQLQKISEVKALRQAIEDDIEEKNEAQRELARLENQVKDKEVLVGKLELALSESKQILLQIKDLEGTIASNQNKIDAAEEVLAKIKTKRSELQQRAIEVDQQCESEDEIFRAKLSDITSAQKKLTELNSVIDQFETTEKYLLEKNAHGIQSLKSEIAALELQKLKEEEKHLELLKEISGFLNVERNIRDNIEYRQTSLQLESLQNAFDTLDIENAENEQRIYQNKSKELRERIAELNSQHYGKVGEVKQIKDQMQTLQHELETEFKDVEQKFHSEWVNLQTNMLVSTDLQTYSQALDSAIMKYHSMKMNEINRILRELWNQTYKGTDIDGIEIKCEVSTQNKARSYNYRVVMYKKSSELDMRGRCSAGQKVLTSILIRLALAECFGTNCGMIALDEPTTNLDVENAESLAHALNNIIALRKSQKNFQLIVITHDEKFLSHIDGDRFTDNFYRIERDENQHSVIKSLPIHLMETD